MWITCRVLAASLDVKNKKASCVLLPSVLASTYGALLILAVWWVDSFLNSVTLEAGFEFWPGPLQWCLTLGCGLPSLVLSFLLL